MDLTGLIDAHVHAAPDVVPRLLDDIELATQAAAAGMRGVLLKNHTSQTADRASIASRLVPGICIWGGLVLNRAVGGFNPAAVEAAAAYGAKEIWMPTIDSANHLRFHGEDRPGLALDEPGSAQAIRDILAIIARHDLILGTGHLSVMEIVSLVTMARQAKVAKILITHPEAPMTNMPYAVQRDLAAAGCRFERVWVFTTPALGGVLSPRDVIEGIHQVGVESTVLATDMGQIGNPTPVKGLQAFVDACLEAKFSESQVRRMGSENFAEWLT
jgi:hypothetical protein